MVLFRLFAVLLLFLFWPVQPRAQAAAGPNPTLSLDNAVQTLDEEFKSPPVWRQGSLQVQASDKPFNDPSFSWAAGYIWNHAPVGVQPDWPPSGRVFPAWTSNGNADTDPNGDMVAKIGEARSPLTWASTLNINVRPMPAELAATIDKPDPKDYLSGAISSFPFAQRYGVFAMSAKLPRGAGLLPAFWLLPADKQWPPEIDVMEVLGREPTKLYTTVHLKGANHGQVTDTKLDLSADFHEYAVDWGPDRIDWYFDRKLVFSQPTPDDLRKPCYVLANVSVGMPSQWGGAPDSTTKFPATMNIASIKVWQRQGY